MTYKIHRFSWTGETQSIVTHEETVNGKTSGSVEVSRGKYKTGHKPVKTKLTLKYHDKHKPV